MATSRSPGQSGVAKREFSALALSAIALLVALASLIESHTAGRLARWQEFRTNSLAALAEHRRTYSAAVCILAATDTSRGREQLEQFETNLEALEMSLHSLRRANEGQLAQFELLLDRSNSAFRDFDDAIAEFKTSLSAEELKRVTAICGSTGFG